MDTDYPWEPGSAGQEDYANNLVTVVPLEEMADSTLGNFSDYVSDGIDECTLIENKCQVYNYTGNFTLQASFSKLSMIQYEKLAPVVAYTIQEELQRVLSEISINNSHSLVRHEDKLSINKISLCQGN